MPFNILGLIEDSGVYSVHRTSNTTLDSSECGASMIEYALLAALIAVVALGGVTRIGSLAERSFGEVAEVMQAATGFVPTRPVIN